MMAGSRHAGMWSLWCHKPFWGATNHTSCMLNHALCCWFAEIGQHLLPRFPGIKKNPWKKSSIKHTKVLCAGTNAETGEQPIGLQAPVSSLPGAKVLKFQDASCNLIQDVWSKHFFQAGSQSVFSMKCLDGLSTVTAFQKLLRWAFLAILEKRPKIEDGDYEACLLTSCGSLPDFELPILHSKSRLSVSVCYLSDERCLYTK